MSTRPYRVVKDVLDRAGIPASSDLAGEIASGLIEAGYAISTTFDHLEVLERRAVDAEQLITASHVRSTITSVKSELSDLLASVEDWQNAS